MSGKTATVYEFGLYRLDPSEHVLWREGHPVTLSPKVFQTLLVLIEHSGHMLEKNELIKILWPDSFVEESSLMQNISLLRKALGETEAHEFIETIPKCGYRFIAPVKVISLESPDSALPAAVVSHESSVEKLIAGRLEEDQTESEVKSKTDSQGHPTTAPLLPANRNQHPALVFFSLVLLLSIAGGAYLWKTRKGTENRPLGSLNEIRSMAILPFKQLGDETDANGHLGLSMADALIVKLSRFQQLSILPTSTVFRYVGREHDALAAGRELGVEAVLDGTVQRAGDRVRVTMMLIRVRDGKALWSEKFDARFTDIFTLQDSISEQVAANLSTRLTNEERQQIAKRDTKSIEAYQSYMMGLYFANKRTKEGLTKSVEFFEQAVQQDPNYARAYAGLADSKYLIAYYRFNSAPLPEGYNEAKRLASKALELDGTLGDAYATLAVTEPNMEKASALFRKAIELNPSSVNAHVRYGWFLFRPDAFDKALEEMKRAQELDPISPLTNCALAQMYYCQRNFDEAIRFSRRALELEPDLFLAHTLLSDVYERRGMYKEMRDTINEARKWADDDSQLGDILETDGRLSALTGRRDDALKAIDELKELYRKKSDNVLPVSIALVYDALGDRDEALKWIEERFEKTGCLPILYRFDPRLDNIKSDPRFSEVRHRAIQKYQGNLDAESKSPQQSSMENRELEAMETRLCESCLS